MIMATHARWLLVPALLVMGCSTWNKLFPSTDKKTTPDAAGMIPDGGESIQPAGGPDGAPGGGAEVLGVRGADTAPAVSLPLQPAPSVAVEAPAIKATVGALCAALAARNVDAAAAQFAPEVRVAYRAMLASAPSDKLDALAAALAQINVTTAVTASVNRADMRAEATVALDGRTFHIVLVKHDNQWLLQSL